MGAHALGPAMVDRADVEVARFEVAEAAFDLAEALVGEDDAAAGKPSSGRLVRIT